MTPLTYPNKPARLDTVQDLLDFALSIPDDRWCAGANNDGCGRSCLAGHIVHAYDSNIGGDAPIARGVAGFVQANDGSNLPNPDLSSPAIKARVVAFLKERVNH